MKAEITAEEALVIVQKIIHEVNGIPLKSIKSSDSLITDLAMDSIELIDFMLRLEEFDVVINESQLSTYLTVAHIVNLMIKQR